MKPHDVRIDLAPPDDPDAEWCLARYYETLDELFEGGFRLDRSLVPDASAFSLPSGAFLVARLGRRPVGCGGVTIEGRGVGYIKRMWVDPSARGLGLGRRLLHELEEAARGLGCTSVQLETNRALHAAIHMYRTAGYVEVDPFNDEHYAHHWFRKELTPEATSWNP
jgi:GNAT superfamily N-acetyltransferase